mmetsp:Transcript_4128/g.7945  ORF Transcript_4128/g.7945 Transcript_4128/m.7945 type:complete len:249 (-) Transcript_4128:633-1379(-)
MRPHRSASQMNCCWERSRSGSPVASVKMRLSSRWKRANTSMTSLVYSRSLRKTLRSKHATGASRLRVLPMNSMYPCRVSLTSSDFWNCMESRMTHSRNSNRKKAFSLLASFSAFLALLVVASSSLISLNSARRSTMWLFAVLDPSLMSSFSRRPAQYANSLKSSKLMQVKLHSSDRQQKYVKQLHSMSYSSRSVFLKKFPSGWFFTLPVSFSSLASSYFFLNSTKDFFLSMRAQSALNILSRRLATSK